MPARRSKSTRVKDAVEDAVWSAAWANADPKPSDGLRAFVLGLNHMAEWQTGFCKFGGQRNIEEHQGIPRWKIKRLRAELRERPDLPVQVIWTANVCDDGTRDGDSYQLVVTGDESDTTPGDDLDTTPGDESVTGVVTTLGTKGDTLRGAKITDSSPSSLLTSLDQSGPVTEEETSTPPLSAVGGGAHKEKPQPLTLPPEWTPPAEAEPARVEDFRDAFAPGAAALVIPTDERGRPERAPVGYSVNWDRTFRGWSRVTSRVFVACDSGAAALYDVTHATPQPKGHQPGAYAPQCTTTQEATHVQ